VAQPTSAQLEPGKQQQKEEHATRAQTKTKHETRAQKHDDLPLANARPRQWNSHQNPEWHPLRKKASPDSTWGSLSALGVQGKAYKQVRNGLAAVLIFQQHLRSRCKQKEELLKFMA
jgi:hypothetical protein